MDFGLTYKPQLYVIYNHCWQNIVDISSSLFKLRIQNDFNQTRYEKGARDVKNIWVTLVTI